jgi:hypothetical protein
MAAILILLASCSLDEAPSPTEKQAEVDFDLLYSVPKSQISFAQSVKPILERRCVACHGCYDASCQLKLTSIEGVLRGASKELVYDYSRLTGIEPTRLFVDATEITEWREKGFHPVLNESPAQQPVDNLENSVLYKFLRLKQRNPQPRVGMLPDSVDVSLDRAQVCPTNEEFHDFAESNPYWGMPYGMPNLEDHEYRILVHWIAQGAPISAANEEVSAGLLKQVSQWEDFLNEGSKKQRLVSRYIYEHLFLAHIHFADTNERRFYRLVRSTTPPGEPIDEIATIRPFDDPGVDLFFYRLRPFTPIVVSKSHVVYELSDDKMARYRELFLDPPYDVTDLPSYTQESTANPFSVFAPIPPISRYRFLLDDAQFFIEGFIKGPVCRGQIALNVIADHFWVMFFDPDRVTVSIDPDFLSSMSVYLETPADEGDTLQLLSIWSDYWIRQKQYLDAKHAFFKKVHTHDLEDALGYIWDGEGQNPNAALTVFRHFDSASVKHGLLGDYPETAWIIDYPIFERIHYLLVAGFNVYGNVGHQLNSRLYMDFLRMEAEDHLLVFLPAAERKRIRDKWYVGIREELNDEFEQSMDWLAVESVIGYETDDPLHELFEHLENRLDVLEKTRDDLNRCKDVVCRRTGASEDENFADQAMARVASIKGAILRVFPDLAFVRVRNKNGGSDFAYSLIRNREYKNISSMFFDESRANPDEDTLTVLRGLEGSFPQFFFDVHIDELDLFADSITKIETREDYERFVGRFGVRRTNGEFWSIADWFNDWYRKADPVRYGVFDLNRYRNR